MSQPHALLQPNPRVLIIDDNRMIHDDFRKILHSGRDGDRDLDDEAAALFADTVEPAGPAASVNGSAFNLDSAYQGQEALGLVRQAVVEQRPYAMAFLDVRMPPGWDGVETAFHLWEACPDLQIVICTAYSDYSWDEMVTKLKTPDQLLILKKPFETMEVMQLAHALTEKWRLLQATRTKLEELERLVRARTAVLQDTNQKLETANRELTAAMASVKTLGGLLPICAHCKKIRDDKGYWNQIELFIRDHSSAKFSHGICPPCAHAMYPQLYPDSK